MFLHIGSNQVVKIKDIVAIMDIERTTTSQITRKYLKRCEEKGIIKTIGMDIPKTFIITREGGEDRVYLSPISSSTLNKRVSKPLKSDRRN